jgi:uncharacterized protein (TIGR00156 family)
MHVSKETAHPAISDHQPGVADSGSAHNTEVRQVISNIKRNAIILSSIIAFSIPLTAQAQYVGPSTQKAPMTVADVLKNPVDDQDVVLRGHLIKKVGNEKYLFSDGTGEIRVDIEAEDFPVQKIDDKTLIVIRGEVENDFLKSPEIDVEMISIAQ